MFIDDSGNVEWDNLPLSLAMNIEKDQSLLRQYPLEMLNMVLLEQLQDHSGMRPHDEIARLVTESIEIKKTNPNLDYFMIKKIDEGGFG